jgi:hypothetical protein
MDLISLVTSLAALVTAIAAFLSVLEMRRQRATLYRPDLAISPAVFFVYADTASVIGNAVSCSTRPYDQFGRRPPEIPGLELECFNVGLGAAKEVSVEWSFDRDAVLGIVKRLAETHGMSVECRENEFVLLDPKGEVLTSRIVFAGVPATQTFPYVLPVQVRTSPQPIELPLEYSKAIALYASYFVEPDEQGATEREAGQFGGPVTVVPQLDSPFEFTFPPATASLSFRDIGGKKHVRTVHICPTLVQIQQLPRDRDHIQLFGRGVLHVVTSDVPPKVKPMRSPRSFSRLVPVRDHDTQAD